MIPAHWWIGPREPRRAHVAMARNSAEHPQQSAIGQVRSGSWTDGVGATTTAVLPLYTPQRTDVDGFDSFNVCANERT